MYQLAGRHLGLDGVEEADELLMPVALHTAADDLARSYVQPGEQGGGAIADVVVGMVPQRPRLSGRPGWVRSNA